MTGPRYVAIDGPDGCGKTTLARALTAHLRAAGRDVMHVREPGSTPFAERLRAALLDPAIGETDPVTDALAFSAARRELVVHEIGPALARGATVISERCFASTWVYQCVAPEDPARRVEPAALAAITAIVHGTIRPERLLIVDVPVAEAVRRLGAAGPLDRIEARGDAYRERVHGGFRALARGEGWVADFVGGAAQVRSIDGTAAPEAVLRAALEAIR